MSLGDRTVAGLFARRHESPFVRMLCRSAIRDLRLWRRVFAG